MKGLFNKLNNPNEETSIIRSEFFQVLAESQKYVLGHEWEYTYLHIKENHKDIELFKFSGTPECGVIIDDYNCCLVGGDVLVVWKNGDIRVIETETLKWIVDMRIKNTKVVEILTDPWSEQSAVWEIDITNLSYKKVREFNHYKGKPYQEEIEW